VRLKVGRAGPLAHGGNPVMTADSPRPEGRPVAISQCEADILLALADLPEGERRIARVLRDDLERRGKCWGLCTVQLAARALLRLGHLNNDHDRLGYGLTFEGRELSRTLRS